MLLSLILPVYNVEAYLGKCLESCLCQNLPKTEYEIIVVIDGSSDHSIDVAQSYHASHDNVKIVTRENGGLSAARNTGLKVAKGDYVWFIDSDDYITENILGDILDVLRKNQLESLWLDWQEVDEEGKVIPPFAPHCYRSSNKVMSGKNFMSDVLSNFLFSWSFIFQRSFLIENNLLFTEGMYYEDTDFAFRCLPLVSRIMKYDKICYNYLRRKGSICHSLNKKKLEDMVKNCISATIALKSCDAPLKRFYNVCFTAFYMYALKETLKSGEKEYSDYLTEQTYINNFGKVVMYGNIKTKILELAYNLLGIRRLYAVLNMVQNHIK